MIKNLTARTIKVSQGSKVASMEAANVVLHMLAPQDATPVKTETNIMKSTNVEVSQRDLPMSSDNSKEMKQIVHERGTTSMCTDDAGLLEDPIEVATSKLEVDRMPLPPKQMKQLFEQIKLEEGTTHWTAEQRSKVRTVIERKSFLFAMTSLDLGRTDLVKHHIQLDDYTPIKDRYRRIPPHQYEEVRKHLEEMLDIGAIRRSNSPWASPVVLVRKKDGSLRFCIDLRKLNAWTVKDAYSLPHIEDTLESFNGACIFTSLDLKSGYWQVKLNEESIPLTTFMVGLLGFYECVRMLFGLTNAPATFQRLMESCLGELHLDWCIIYLDDIIIFSKNPDDHITRLEGVFEKLAKAGLKLKPSKCEFFHSSLKYLGHIVSKDGIATDPRKIEAICNWPCPKTVTDIRSFTGFTNYYRKFIKGYAKIARPLYKLTSGDNAKRKNQKVDWNTRCNDFFEALKSICSECPVLAYADYTKPFVLHTDALTTGLGAVLYQKQEDGKERVITYASHTLNKSEWNYDAHKLEFLALKWAITDRFHEYLYGATFDVYTDNNPLTYILSTVDAMGHRWVASLGPYNFALHYKPGRLNCDADALSHISWESVSPAVVQATMDLAHVDRTLILDPEVRGQKSVDEPFVLKSLRINEAIRKWQQRQKEDAEIRKIIEMMHNNDWSTYKYSKNEPSSMKSYIKVRADLELKNGLLYRRIRLKDHEVDTYQLVVPVAYRKITLELLHDKFGHLGIDRTTGLSCERFFWPRIADEIRQYIQNCEHCLRYKQQPEWAELKPLEASYPLELVHMDYLKIGGKDDPNSNILVVTDHFTRFSQAYVTANQLAATAARVFVREFVNNYG